MEGGRTKPHVHVLAGGVAGRRLVRLWEIVRRDALRGRHRAVPHQAPGGLPHQARCTCPF